MTGPRILFFDTERAPPMWWDWENPKEHRIHYGQLVAPGYFTSIQWQYDYQNEPSSFSLLDTKGALKKNCDKEIVKKALSLIDDADIVVAHNGKRFDWKHLRARAIYHGLQPIGKPYIIDTLQEAKKSAFPSNSLHGLSGHLGLPEKGTNSANITLLVAGTLEQREEQVRLQTEYGVKDIPPLIALYEKLKPFMDSPPNVGAFHGLPCCPSCGGTELAKKGVRLLQGGRAVRQQWKCRSCHHRFQGAILTRAKFI